MDQWKRQLGLNRTKFISSDMTFCLLSYQQAQRNNCDFCHPHRRCLCEDKLSGRNDQREIPAICEGNSGSHIEAGRDCYYGYPVCSPHSGSPTADRSGGAHVLYLPPYSPNLNPIEKLWSKIKAYLRKCRALTLDVLDKALLCAFSNVTASDCRNWFACAGYC